MTVADAFAVTHYKIAHRRGDYDVLKIDCVPTFVERIVSPAGEDHAFDIQHHRCEVEIYVSPTGRSVQVFVNGSRVAP